MSALQVRMREAPRYTLRLLGWRAPWVLAVFALYTGWGVYVVGAARQIQRDSARRVSWIEHLQEAQRDLLTHHPEDPAIRQALLQLARVAEERRALGTENAAPGLRRAVEALRETLETPIARDQARVALVEAIDTEMQAAFAEISRLSKREAFRWQQLEYLALSAIALASLTLLALLLARHRRLLAERLGERLERAVEEAETARLEAQQASNAKSRFLATVSHELRTPMTAILGTVDLLGRMDLPARQADYLAAIRSAGETLQALIEDVLDLSRIEAGRLDLIDEEFDLGVLLDDLALMFAGRAEGKGLSLTVHTSPDLPCAVRGDSLRLRQVLVNLLGNAIKFTERGRVRLRAEPAGTGPDRIAFEVNDTGPGLSADQIARIFTPFTQVDSSLTRAHGGAGLGLAISKRLVEAMGGSLGVESEAGRGARFRFEARLITVAPAPTPHAAGPILLVGEGPALEAVAEQLETWGLPAAREVAPETARARLDALLDGPAGVVLVGVGAEAFYHPALLTWRGFVLRPFGEPLAPAGPSLSPLTGPVRPGLVMALLRPPSVVAEPRPAAPVASDLAGCRVLVVDDNEMNRLVLAEMLVTLDCRVNLASSGAQALERCAVETFALILMDAEMPELDGFETTRLLREAGVRRPATAIVGLSGHVTPEHRAEGLAAGMDDYLAKPIQLATLQRALARWCDEDR